jgi:hypothetical protein
VMRSMAIEGGQGLFFYFRGWGRGVRLWVDV